MLRQLDILVFVSEAAAGWEGECDSGAGRIFPCSCRDVEGAETQLESFVGEEVVAPETNDLVMALG